MEHDFNPEDKQVYEDGQSQRRFLAWVLFRLDREAPKENHRLRCDARAGPEGNSLNVHSWLLVYY